MMRRFVIGLAMAAVSSMASAQTVEDLVAGRPDQEVIDLWDQNDKICAADISGEVTVECLARTDLADVLRKRGWCQSAINGKWAKCIVGLGGGAIWSPPADGPFATKKKLIQEKPDNGYTIGIDGDQSVSPS